MKNNLLIEELKRFNRLVKYDPKNPMINEDTENSIPKKIIDKLKPDLPFNENSGTIESILLLQKTLVALGKLNKDYGIDNDGVDGDFGSDTKTALKSVINSDELSENNIGVFETFLEKNKSKITNVISDYESFIERFKDMGGVTLDKMEICKTGKGTSRKGSDVYYPNLNYVLKGKKCVTKEDMAKAINNTFPELNILGKSAILSVMIKEQGTGDKICGPNYNYSGIQTDSGKWGEGKDEKITGMFCSKDSAGVRSFASFDTLEDGVSFMKKSFDDKEWFIKLLKDVNEDEVEKEGFNLEIVSDRNKDIWQTNWNLKLNSEEYENFKNYGYNPNLKNTSFSDRKGIYSKSVEDFTEEEKILHDNNIKNYRSPKSIQNALNSMSDLFRQSFNIFKKITKPQ